MDLIKEYNDRFAGKSAIEVLEFFLETYKGKIALASSLGLEDQVLAHMVVQIDPKVRIFTLDTGRLYPETYDLIDRTNHRFGINMEVYFPRHEDVQYMVKEKGINLFYESIENRKLCCNIRKIEPLHRALGDAEAWITGLRRNQSITRTNGQLAELDANNNGRIKLNPLIEWTEGQVWNYIETHNIPYHKLHDQGFPSIGCQPCTRAVMPGEDFRAGRWWWEKPEQKECGLHKR